MVIKSAFLLKREMSSSDANVIVAWNNTSAAINRYSSIFIFLFGTVGNILNYPV
jgi:hypothetical protein